MKKIDPEAERERRILDEMQRCLHFTGIQNESCRAGVNYRAHVGGTFIGWACRLPCVSPRFSDFEDKIVPCALRLLPTREQAEATEAEKERVSAAVLAHLATGAPLPAGVSVMVCREEDAELL